MSTSASSPTALPAALLASRTLETVIRFLMPYFSIDCPDFAATRDEILETLTSYAPRNRAELFATAKLIACTMTALSAMAEAEGADLTPSMRLRVRACANTVNRHANQAQQALDKHQARDIPARPISASPIPAQDIEVEEDPAVADAKDAEVIERLRQVKTMIETTRQRLAETNPEAARRLYLAQMGVDECPAGVRESRIAAHATIPPHLATSPQAAIPPRAAIRPGAAIQPGARPAA
ncbi:hypothetical protein [Rhodopila sp.]|uniref:hypothetical protein n=1 Tax=Rhodopila sp. TaxID=2480087 RepID=UPI003D149DB7